jgi:hypothetical protein
MEVSISSMYATIFIRSYEVIKERDINCIDEWRIIKNMVFIVLDTTIILVQFIASPL